MSEQLYRKVPKGKSFRYEPYVEDPREALTEVDSERVFTILATMLISMITRIAEQLPSHSRKCRELIKAGEAAAALASLHHTALSQDDIEIGVKVWGAAVAELQRQLSGETI